MPHTENPHYDLTAVAQAAHTLITAGYQFGDEPIEPGADAKPVQADLLDVPHNEN